MKPSETAVLLAKAAAIDSRTIDEITVAAWHEVVGDLALADAMVALTAHRRESTEYLTPNHIVTRVKAVQRGRVAAWKAENRCDVPEIPADLDPIQERAWLRIFWADVRDGHEHPEDVADHAIGVTRQALPPADPSKVRAIEALAASKDTRRARAEALRDINQEARA